MFEDQNVDFFIWKLEKCSKLHETIQVESCGNKETMPQEKLITCYQTTICSMSIPVLGWEKQGLVCLSCSRVHRTIPCTREHGIISATIYAILQERDKKNIFRIQGASCMYYVVRLAVVMRLQAITSFLKYSVYFFPKKILKLFCWKPSEG